MKFKDKYETILKMSVMLVLSILYFTIFSLSVIFVFVVLTYQPFDNFKYNITTNILIIELINLVIIGASLYMFERTGFMKWLNV